MQVVLPADARLLENTLDLPVVDLEATIGEAPLELRALVGRVANGFGKRGCPAKLGLHLDDPGVELLEQGQRLALPQCVASSRVKLEFLASASSL